MPSPGEVNIEPMHGHRVRGWPTIANTVARLAAGTFAFGVLCGVTSASDAERPIERIGGREVLFRGCDAAGWCRFVTEHSDPSAVVQYRVRPRGVAQTSGDGAAALAVRDRLNALLSSMIHQNKQIVLEGLRELDDGTFTATVIVNGIDVVPDPLLPQADVPSVDGMR